MDLSLHQAVFNLRTLRRLRLNGWIQDTRTDENWEIAMKNSRPMTELIYSVWCVESWLLSGIFRQSGLALEVLFLFPQGQHYVDLTPETPRPTSSLFGRVRSPSEQPSRHHHQSSLTHLDVQVRLSISSLELLSSVLPRLELTHFGCDRHSQGLLQHCNLTTLKSLSILDPNDNDMRILQETMEHSAIIDPFWKGPEQLFIQRMQPGNASLIRFLQYVQPTRLYLDDFTYRILALVLDIVDFSKIDKLSIRSSMYYETTENILVGRVHEFTESLVIYLDNDSLNHYTSSGGRPRTTEGSPKSLPSHRVKPTGGIDFQEHYYRFIHILPSFSY